MTVTVEVSWNAPTPQLPPPPSGDFLPFSARLHPKVLSSRSFPQGASRSHIRGGLSLLLLAVFSVYGLCMLFVSLKPQEDLGLLPAPPWLDQNVRSTQHTSGSQIASMETPGESAGKPRFCDAPRPFSGQPHYVRLILSTPLPLSQLGTGVPQHQGQLSKC